MTGARAESLTQYLRKGSRVYVDGRLEARPWTDRENQTQAGLEVMADSVEFMSSRVEDERRGDAGGPSHESGAPSAGPSGAAPAPQSAPPQSRPAPEDTSDLEDLPF